MFTDKVGLSYYLVFHTNTLCMPTVIVDYEFNKYLELLLREISGSKSKNLAVFLL